LKALHPGFRERSEVPVDDEALAPLVQEILDALDVLAGGAD
jgi:hypothetical protein